MAKKKEMMASELVKFLQQQIKENGDQPVVYGVDQTGYGNPVKDVVFEPEVLDLKGNKRPVFDLPIQQSSLVATGGF